MDDIYPVTELNWREEERTGMEELWNRSPPTISPFSLETDKNADQISKSSNKEQMPNR